MLYCRQLSVRAPSRAHRRRITSRTTPSCRIWTCVPASSLVHTPYTINHASSVVYFLISACSLSVSVCVPVCLASKWVFMLIRAVATSSPHLNVNAMCVQLNWLVWLWVCVCCSLSLFRIILKCKRYDGANRWILLLLNTYAHITQSSLIK